MRVGHWVVVLMVVAVICGSLRARFVGETFPLADWAMYSKVPARYGYCTLKIHRWAGEELDPPRLAREWPELRETIRAANNFRNVDRLGYYARRALKGWGNEHDAEARRVLVEGALLPEDTRYELVYHGGNLFEMYRDQKYEVVESIVILEVGEPSPWADEL